MCRGNVVQSTTKILSELRTSLPGGVGLAVVFVLGPRPESPTRPTFNVLFMSGGVLFQVLLRVACCLRCIVGLKSYSYAILESYSYAI